MTMGHSRQDWKQFKQPGAVDCLHAQPTVGDPRARRTHPPFASRSIDTTAQSVPPANCKGGIRHALQCGALPVSVHNVTAYHTTARTTTTLTQTTDCGEHVVRGRRHGQSIDYTAKTGCPVTQQHTAKLVYLYAKLGALRGVEVLSCTTA